MAKIKEIRTKVVDSELGIPDFGTGSDYLLVKVIDDDGNFGIGYIPEIFKITGDPSLARVFEHMVSSVFAPMIKNKDAEYIEEIWENLFRASTRWGRRG